MILFKDQLKKKVDLISIRSLIFRIVKISFLESQGKKIF